MKCKAHSVRTGKPCGMNAIAGATVCKMHGGAAPQVKKSAALRLAALVDPAIGVVRDNLKDRAINPQVAQRAAEDVLDRNGYASPETIRLIGSGDGGAIQIEDVSSDELLERGIARILQRKRAPRDLGDDDRGSET